MPDGVYFDGHGTLGSGPGPSLSVGDLIARIAQQSRVAPQAGSGEGTREAPMPSGALYDNVDHPTLKAMVTENVDPNQVGTLASAWQAAGARLAQFQDDVTGAIHSSRSEWQGEAGDAARQFIGAVGHWIGDAGRGAQLAGTQAAKHSEALAAAKNAMPEPVLFDVDAANAELRQITDPVRLLNRYAEHLQAYNAQQAAQRQAAAVVTAYDTALAESGTMPAFAPPPAMAGSSGAPPMPRTSSDGPSNGTTPMSAAPSPAFGRMPESTAPPQATPAASVEAQPPSAVPFAGGFAMGPVDNGARTAESLPQAVPGGPAAANYLVDDGPGTQGPVIGG